MKKQVGILVFMLVAAQMSFAARSATDIRVDIEKKTTAAEVSVRSAAERGQLEQDGTVIRLVKAVDGDLGKLSKALVKQPKLVKTLVFVEEVNSKPSDHSALEVRAADAGKQIMSIYGTSKNLKAEGQAEAMAEKKTTQRFAELIPNLASYGEKAVRLAEVTVDGAIRKGLPLNRALRDAAVDVLGLKGKDLETFMKDPENGLGGCKE